MQNGSFSLIIWKEIFNFQGIEHERKHLSMFLKHAQTFKISQKETFLLHLEVDLKSFSSIDIDIPSIFGFETNETDHKNSYSHLNPRFIEWWICKHEISLRWIYPPCCVYSGLQTERKPWKFEIVSWKKGRKGRTRNHKQRKLTKNRCNKYSTPDTTEKSLVWWQIEREKHSRE